MLQESQSMNILMQHKGCRQRIAQDYVLCLKFLCLLHLWYLRPLQIWSSRTSWIYFFVKLYKVNFSYFTRELQTKCNNMYLRVMKLVVTHSSETTWLRWPLNMSFYKLFKWLWQYSFILHFRISILLKLLRFHISEEDYGLQDRHMQKKATSELSYIFQLVLS